MLKQLEEQVVKRTESTGSGLIMKSVKKVLLVGGLVLGLTSANALEWIDTQLSPSANAGTFNITSYGYNPALHVVDSATVEFRFEGEGTGVPEERIWQIDAVTTVGNFTAKNSSYSIISWGAGGGLSAVQLADLSADGLIDWSVVLGLYGESITVTSAKLIARGSDRPTVPDGGATAALLGLGILALGAFKRKFNAA